VGGGIISDYKVSRKTLSKTEKYYMLVSTCTVWVCVVKRRQRFGEDGRNVQSMKWRVSEKEVDQRGPGERPCKKTVKHVN